MRHQTASIIASLAVVSGAAHAGSYLSWCQTWFTLEERTSGLASPLLDPDRDGCPNLTEYLSGTSPLDSTARLTGELLMTAEGSATVTYSLDPFATEARGDCEVSHDLVTWWRHGILLPSSPDLCHDLNGYRFARLATEPAPGAFLDSDGDGLEDYFEEALIAATTEDGLESLADILPEDDFDSDGTLNIDEANNAPITSGTAKPPFLDPMVISGAIGATSPASPTALLVHTPLL